MAGLSDIGLNDLQKQLTELQSLGYDISTVPRQLGLGPAGINLVNQLLNRQGAPPVPQQMVPQQSRFQQHVLPQQALAPQSIPPHVLQQAHPYQPYQQTQTPIIPQQTSPQQISQQSPQEYIQRQTPGVRNEPLPCGCNPTPQVPFTGPHFPGHRRNNIQHEIVGPRAPVSYGQAVTPTEPLAPQFDSRIGGQERIDSVTNSTRKDQWNPAISRQIENLLDMDDDAAETAVSAPNVLPLERREHEIHQPHKSPRVFVNAGTQSPRTFVDAETQSSMPVQKPRRPIRPPTAPALIPESESPSSLLRKPLREIPIHFSESPRRQSLPASFSQRNPSETQEKKGAESAPRRRQRRVSFDESTIAEKFRVAEQKAMDSKEEKTAGGESGTNQKEIHSGDDEGFIRYMNSVWGRLPVKDPSGAATSS